MALVDFRTPPCIRCNKSSVVTVDFNDFQKWREGAFIQVAFPYLTPEQRELLISGIHPDCWSRMFGKGE